MSNKNMGVHFSESSNGGSDNWQTPDSLFKELNRVFRFNVDAAASAENAKCKRFFSAENSALTNSLKCGDVAYVNPPYSMLREFMEWAIKQKANGATVVCLVPSRTDTKAWHQCCAKGEIRFIQGRVKFFQPGAPKQNGAPFPSALIVFRPRLNDLNL